MKLKIKLIVAVALAGIVGYTSCQKSTVKTTPPPVNYNSIASQIALSLNNSLTGQYGGANINDGVKAPASITPSKSGKALFAVPFCGYQIDTTYSSYTTSGDTIKWLSGQLNFTFTCTNTAVDGYNVYDTLRTEVHNSTFVDEYTNAQNYAFKTINSSSSSLNGYIRTLISTTNYPITTVSYQVYHAMSCYYALSGLVITTTNGVADVTAGTATFNSKTSDIDVQTGPDGVFGNYTGSLTWIGNHKADLTIDPGHKFVIDFTTNTITPAQ
jgi:hypothetical protein